MCAIKDESELDFGSVGSPDTGSSFGISKDNDSCLTDAIPYHFPDDCSPRFVLAFSGERPPTMPSADFCTAVTSDCSGVSCSLNTVQTSRGKTLNFPCVDAQFIKRTPIADGGLSGHVPTGPEYVTPHIGFLFVASQFCVGLPSDPALRHRPCPFANLLLCEYLIRGLSPLELSAMLGTHACSRSRRLSV